MDAQYDALPFDGLLDDQSFDVDSWMLMDALNAFPGDGASSSDDTSTPAGAPEASSTSSATASEVSSPAVYVPELSQRRRRVPQSQRVRAEQVYLRAQILSLERQLATMMASRAVAHLSAPRTAWRAVAKRQAARRRGAEEENERLRAQLERQLQLAILLQSAIRESANDYSRSSLPAATSWRPIRYGLRDDLERLLDKFMDDIDYAYAAVDRVIPGEDQDARVSLLERPPSQTSVRALATDGSHAPFYTELRQTLVLPFSLGKVQPVLWQAVSGEFARQHRELERYRYAQGVHACKFLAPPSQDGASEREDAITTISRLFVEESRSVLIWRSFRSTANGGSFSEAQCLNTGWVVLRPLEGIRDHVVVHVCSRGVPLRGTVIPTGCDDPASPLAQTDEVKAFLKETLRVTENKVPRFMDAVENLLLDGIRA